MPRLIHASGSSPWKSVGTWIAYTLKLAWRTYTHLTRDTDHLLQLLNDFRADPNDMLLKADIDDFFMSGDHRALVNAAKIAATGVAAPGKNECISAPKRRNYAKFTGCESKLFFVQVALSGLKLA